MSKGRKQSSGNGGDSSEPKYEPKYSFDVKREESLRSIQERDPGKRTSWHWSEVWQEAHEDAFVVAKMVRGDLLKEVHDSLERAIANGTPFEKWKKEIVPKLQGEWIGKTVGELWDELPDEEKANRDKPEGKEREKVITAHRLRTIYEVNMRVANARERYKQLEDRKESLPYWQYVSLKDNRTRASHFEARNLVFRHDDVFWETHYPPNGWNCRCYVVPVDEKIIKANGLRKATGEGHIYWSADSKGREFAVYDGTTPRLACDPGWSYCVGRENRLKQTAAEKEKTYPPELKKQADKAQAEHDKQRAKDEAARQDKAQQTNEQAPQPPSNEQAQQPQQTASNEQAQQPQQAPQSTGNEQPNTEPTKPEPEQKQAERKSVKPDKEQPGTKQTKGEAESKQAERDKQKATQNKAQQDNAQKKQETDQKQAGKQAAEHKPASNRAKGSVKPYDKLKDGIQTKQAERTEKIAEAAETVEKAVSEAQKQAADAVRQVADGTATAKESLKHIIDVRDALRSDFDAIAVEDTAYKRLDQQIAEAKEKIEQAEAIRQALEKAEQNIREAGTAITKEASSIKAAPPSSETVQAALELADRGISGLSGLVRLSSDAATDSENSLREVLHITSSELLERTREAAKNAADPDLRKYLEGVASQLSRLIDKKTPLRETATALQEASQSIAQIEHFASKKHAKSEQKEHTSANNVHHGIDQLHENADKEGEIPAFSEEPSVPHGEGKPAKAIIEVDGKLVETDIVVGTKYEYPQYHSIDEAQRIMKNYKLEHVLVFDNNGVCVCEVVGDEHEVDFSFLQLIAKTGLTIIHNHPSLTVFSKEDVDQASKYYHKIKDFRVVCGENIYAVDPTVCTPDIYFQALSNAEFYIITNNIGIRPNSLSIQSAAMWVYLLSNYDGIIKIES